MGKKIIYNTIPLVICDKEKSFTIDIPCKLTIKGKGADFKETQSEKETRKKMRKLVKKTLRRLKREKRI